ncbi:MAG TPA: ATP-dependent helicase, partial [Bdellovibrionota bacterium]|nr:ATP-dependent helicase [Bdellovibrionota bacterium]
MSSAGIAAAPSAEQSAVIESWGRGQAVLAGAGCGKTTTLVAKCAALLARSPDARFAAVSFTEKSAGDLRKKLALGLPRREDGPPLGPHWVMTIHGLCRSVIREFPTEAEIDGEETLLDEAESRRLWEQVLDGLWFEPLPEGVDADIEKLLERQSRADLEKLLDRMRDLSAFGAAERLAGEGSRAEALLRVHSHAEERYLRLKRKRGALDFGDLEARARIALTHAHVRRAYHTRFELVLVDEFQDTNPVQAEILWAFSRPDQSNLCVVGDPKQSIYRFRDADVTVFEDLCAKLPLRQSLTGNYRCRPGIIDVTNAVCAPAFEASNLGYEPLRAARPAAGEGGLEPVLRLDLRGPADLADWVAAEVTAGRPLEDMALLLKRVRGAEKWLRPLAAKGVPLALGSGGLFWDDPRVRELTAMLRWWDQPGQTLAGAAFLRAPWVAIPDATLDEWIRPNRGQELAKRFFESTHPLAARLAPLWNGSTRPGELVMAVLEDPRAEAELGAAGLGLWHRAEELSSKGLDAAAVVREMVRASDERNRERDVPPPRNQGQLQVLTLHGAKGLEFKRVILVDFEGKARAQAMPEVYWDRKTGAYLAARDEG